MEQYVFKLGDKMIVINKSDFNLTLVVDDQKFALGLGKKITVDLIEKTKISIYINQKPNIQYKLFPLFRASHFLEDHLNLNLFFSFSCVVEKECTSLEIINCIYRCETPIRLISITLDDYTNIENISFFPQPYEKVTKKFLVYQIIFIFLLPLWILGCGLGFAYKESKLLFFSILCMLISSIELYKLIKSVKQLTEIKMINLLKQKAKMIENAKSKDKPSYEILKRYL